MIYEIMGIAAFAAFGLYDVNSVIWKNRIADKLFFAGSAAVTVSCVLAVYDAVTAGKSLMDIPPEIKTAALIAGVISVVLLVYTLFFAIPFRDTYVDSDGAGKRTVCRNGMYALCRHPGVLWFTVAGICICIVFTTRDMLMFTGTVCVMNVLYIMLQDKWTFIHTFSDYEDYRKETPFLIPRISGIVKCFGTMKG